MTLRRVLAWVAVVVATAFAAYSVLRLDHARDEQRRVEAAVQAAVTYLPQVLSYTPATLTGDLARARGHLTGPFARRYDELARDLITPAARQKGVATRAEVISAGVAGSRGPRVTVLVFVGQVTTSAASPQPRTSGSRLLVTMSEVDGRWRITGLRPV